MIEKMKKYQRTWLIVLIVICMGTILAGGVYYLHTLREQLTDQAIENVQTVTKQQQQAFDTFIAGDRERLHSYAEFFSGHDSCKPEEFQKQLSMFDDVDAIYLVMCLDEGWICGTSFDDIRQLDPEDIETYRSLGASGVRDTYTGLYSKTPRFGFYETFTFSNGHTGLIQKSYNRSKVSATFSLSFYNDTGFAYVVNREGDILLRSVVDEQLHENIFDILTGTNHQGDIDAFQKALYTEETGSITFTGDSDSYVYTYVPVENVEGWYLVSIVPWGAITAAADQILMDTRITLGFFALLLVISIVFMLLIWRTNQELRDKEREAVYQSQKFDILSAYLSRNTNDVYMMYDVRNKRIEYVSPNLDRVMGISIERFASDLLTFEAVSSAGETWNLDRLCRLEPGTGTEAVTSEWTNPRTREQMWFQESVYCVQIQELDKLVIYISDRTQEHKTQAALSEALHMAQAANDAKSAFLSSVSHDIRTPMNAIIGFLTLMRNEVENPEAVREYIHRIDTASQHLLGLINDVLDMNKIESGSTTLSISELDLAGIIEEINAIIRPQTRAKNQVFDIFASHLKYEHLMGDKLRINQILINLLSNAVKYTPEGGTIRLRVEELEQVVGNYSRIRFTISDNGLGMSANYLKVIFDPFTREETKITHEIQGTGLGMAITKRLVDLMGGVIHVESTLNKGSTFTVELELRIKEQEDDSQFWTDHGVARMIVVDDDEEICLNIVKAMSRAGVSVNYATDGETAVQLIRSAGKAGNPYSLILLDWKMPGLSGLDTARMIRKEYSENIPILLLTAYDWSDIEHEATEIGVNHFLPKPFFVSTFKEAIRRVMGGLEKSNRTRSDVVRGRHILVVDDIEVNQIILLKLLGTLGADCDTASNGQEAVDRFEASAPGEYDLILMDVQMPVMDGYTATRLIRSSPHPSAQTVPIIAMTANAFVDDMRDAIESGMDAHVAKPIQLDNLKTTMQKVLDSRQISTK